MRIGERTITFAGWKCFRENDELVGIWTVNESPSDYYPLLFSLRDLPRDVDAAVETLAPHVEHGRQYFKAPR